jgi:hypothetical protein
MMNSSSNVMQLFADKRTKVCSDCKVEKSIDDFSFHKHSSAYLSKCKPCNAAYAKLHRGAYNPEKNRIRHQRHWNKLKSDPVRLAERNANRTDYKPKGYDSRRKFLIEGGRICNCCNVGKQWDQFRNDKHGFNGKTPRCVECLEAKRVPDLRGHGLKDRPNLAKRKYGVTWEHIVKTLEAQHGRCANRACGKEIFLDVPNGAKRANVDHCHKTNKFRALLCVGCNTLLGKLEKDENYYLGLLEYAAKHK